MKKILILLCVPLTSQNYYRVGLPYLDKSCDVTVFDCMEWLGMEQSGISEPKMTYTKFIKIHNFIIFRERLNELKPDYVIVSNLLLKHFSRIKKEVKNIGAMMCVVQSGKLPQLNWHYKLVRRLSKMPINHSLKSGGLYNESICLKLVSAVKLKFWQVKNMMLGAPDFYFSAGTAAVFPYTRALSKFINIGSQDYHLWKSVKNIEAPRGNYILFIDDCVVNANDWKLLGLKSPVEAGNYYSLMRYFFDLLERATGKQILIAGHPNSINDADIKKNFGGRDIFFSETPILAINSNYVMTHGSTAISYAILSDKKVLILTSDELENSHYGLHIKMMAKSIGRRPININHPLDLTEITKHDVDKSKYAQYIEKYIIARNCHELAPWNNFIKLVNEHS
jgi:hypothetical protein